MLEKNKQNKNPGTLTTQGKTNPNSDFDVQNHESKWGENIDLSKLTSARNLYHHCIFVFENWALSFERGAFKTLTGRGRVPLNESDLPALDVNAEVGGRVGRGRDGGGPREPIRDGAVGVVQPEVVLGAGKAPAELDHIADRLRPGILKFTN